MVFKWFDLGLVFELAKFKNRPPWHASYAQAPNAVVMEDFVRIYFCGRGLPDSHKNFESYGMFVDVVPGNSFKILNISKTPLIPFGSIGEFDEFGTYPISVIRDGDSYIAFYGGWSRPKSVPFDVAIGMATSLDGISFIKNGNGPVLGATPEEPFVITSPKIRKFGNKYVLAYTAGVRWIEFEGKPEIIYRIRIAFSDDGVHWKRLGREIISTVIGEDEAQACPDIYFKNNLYHMFFCYRAGTDFRSNRKRSYKIGYAQSTNLMDWKRADSNSQFARSPVDWNTDMQAYPNVFDYKGNTYMLYLGNQTGLYGFGAARLVIDNE